MLTIRVRAASLFEDVLSQARQWETRHLQAARVKVKFDHGTDAGGLSRHLFTEFGKGLELVCGVTLSCDALLRLQARARARGASHGCSTGVSFPTRHSGSRAIPVTGPFHTRHLTVAWTRGRRC